MRLDGFRCDFCGRESQQPGAPKAWIQVQSLQIGTSFTGSFGTSGGLHYCRRDCLLKAIDTQWERERP